MNLSLINKLNLSHLKIFESVYRLKSMTLAAHELFLTQPGVSQHMKSLEVDLGLPLFVRNRKGLHATEEAALLYKTYLEAFGNFEKTLNQIKNLKKNQPEGVLKIGIPTEFGNNVVIPFLSGWSQKYPLVKFDLIYGYGNNLLEQLENGQLDLAFIDSFQKNKKNASMVVFQENLNLVASKLYLKEKRRSLKIDFLENYKDLLQYDYLEYEHKESILRMWFRYHYQKKNIKLNVKAWAMNVQGIASLVKQGMGVAILPNHLTEKLLKQGVPLFIFKGRKSIQLKNEISLVWPKDKPRSSAADMLLTHLMQKSL